MEGEFRPENASGYTRLRLDAPAAKGWQEIGVYYLEQGQTFRFTVRSLGGTARIADLKLELLEGYTDTAVIWEDVDGIFSAASGWTVTEQPTGHDGGSVHTGSAGAGCSWGAYPPATGNYVFYPQIGVGKRLDGGRRRVKKYLWSF